MNQDRHRSDSGEKSLTESPTKQTGKHTIASIRGIVPPLRDREAGDFEAQIEEAMEEAIKPDADGEEV